MAGLAQWWKSIIDFSGFPAKRQTLT